MHSILAQVVSRVELKEFEQARSLILNQPTFVGELDLVAQLVNRFSSLLVHTTDFGTIVYLCAEIEQSLSRASNALRTWDILLEIDLALMHFHTLECNISYRKNVVPSSKEILKLAKAALAQMKNDLSS